MKRKSPKRTRPWRRFSPLWNAAWCAIPWTDPESSASTSPPWTSWDMIPRKNWWMTASTWSPPPWWTRIKTGSERLSCRWRKKATASAWNTASATKAKSCSISWATSSSYGRTGTWLTSASFWTAPPKSSARTPKG